MQKRLDAQNIQKVLPVFLLVFTFLIIVLRRAWLCDDAYITFRTVDNFINGYGLTWNTVERVQAFTHPLWVFLLSLFYLFTHEIYLTSIFLSVILATLAVFILSSQIARSSSAAIFGALILCLSNPFVDYATSGLENPLSYLLLALFLATFLQGTHSTRHLFFLSLFSSLGAANRLDTVLLYAPALLFAWWTQRSKKAFLVVILGQLPLLAWEIFSVFYYGFPFPNTYYAKLNTGIPALESMVQGGYYLLDTIQNDPLTALMVLSGLGVAFASKDKKSICVGLGMLLYLLYIVKIGGDFMSGRFMTLPLFSAVTVMSISPFFDYDPTNLGDRITSLIQKPDSVWTFLHRLMPSISVVLLYAIVIIVGIRSGNPTIRVRNTTDESTINARGISDERLAYAKWTALFTPEWRSEPTLEDVSGGRDVRAQDQTVVIVRKNIGVFGYYAGPKAFIVDEYALSDALLARLPAVRTVGWRIGHFFRVVPQGYAETLESGVNHIDDAQLAEYYDQLVLITRGDLFDSQRLMAIWKMNTNQYDSLVNFEAYRFPDMVFKTLSEASGTPSESDQSINFTASGLEISLGAVFHSAFIDLSLDSNDQYQIVYRLQDDEIASQTTAQPFAPEGLVDYQLNVPQKAVNNGYDTIRILPLRGDNYNRLGYVKLQ